MEIAYLALCFVLLVSVVMLGIPIGFGMLTVAAVFLVLGDVKVSVLSMTLVGAFDSWTWLAIPLFVMMGYLMNACGITTRLIAFANAFVGHFRGGTALATVATNFLMAGMSGSMLADLASSGVVFAPAMKKEGYPTRFTTTVLGVSAMLGPLIPPSIGFIVYGVMTGVSIGRLFVAGLIPAFLVTILLTVYIVVMARRHQLPVHPRVPLRNGMATAWYALPALLLPVVVIGGMRSGYFTAVEGGGMAVVYVAIVGVLMRGFSRKGIDEAIVETIKLSLALLFVIGTGVLFQSVLSYLGFIQPLLDAFQGFHGTTLFLLATVALCLVMGLVVDTPVIIILFAPLLSSIAKKIGIDPVHYGVVFYFTSLIGTLTPPFATGMFVLMRITDVKLEEYLRGMLPMIVFLIGITLVLVFFPQLVVFLPNLVYGASG